MRFKLYVKIVKIRSLTTSDLCMYIESRSTLLAFVISWTLGAYFEA